MPNTNINLNDEEEVKDLLDEEDPKHEERLVNTQDFGDEDENDTTPAEAERQVDEEEERHRNKPED